MLINPQKNQNENLTQLSEAVHLQTLLSPNLDAAFDAGDRAGEDSCLKDTRVDVLSKIDAWAQGTTDTDSCIYWLSGWAGTGKSTISRTIARKYSDRCELGATFFFSRGSGDAGHARAFFRTLAFQLAEKSPDFKKLIMHAISKQ